jgi:catechol 2,3-dioxygenase-like lactoylglutathione lyase family enzyme
MSTPNRPAMSSFYQDVFGFRRQVSRGGGQMGLAGGQRSGASVADGFTALQFLVYPVTTSDVDPSVTSLGPRHTRFGVNHFGWLVSDLELAVKVLPDGWASIRPSRGMAEWRGLDPDGNEFDLSQTKGYQVDADVWARA